MRSKIVAGNWKMNKNVEESKSLASDLVNELQKISLTNTKVIIAPTYINLIPVLSVTENSVVEVAAQNMHQEEKGAYTGEISANMLTSAGIKTVIIGHSERRLYFNEKEPLLAKKVDTALVNNLHIIYCFGEQLEERKSNNHFNVVKDKIAGALFHLEEKDWKNITLAYEPVWAIGTGENATPEQAQEMHVYVRSVISEKYGKDIANEVSILYGGSCKPSNAKEIFSKPDVDGGLIGGASLKATDFTEIIKAIQ